jgi:methylase of polypeptide subunit release factors
MMRREFEWCFLEVRFGVYDGTSRNKRFSMTAIPMIGVPHDFVTSINRALLQTLLATRKDLNIGEPLKSKLLNFTHSADALSVFSRDVRQQFNKWIESLSPGDLQYAAQTAALNGKSPSDIFDVLVDVLSDDDSTKTKGAVFTPSWLARSLVNTSLRHWETLNPGASVSIAADMSCGVGVFLAELAAKIPMARVIGVDNCPEYVSFARFLNAQFGNVEIHSADTLLTLHNSGQLTLDTITSSIPDKGYDIVVGNPPYVRCQLLDPDYSRRLRDLYPELTVGNFDLSSLFLAHTLEALAPGGVAALIISSKFMTSRYGAEICRRLGQRARILEIVDFGDGQLFRGRTTYVCALTFAKVPPEGRCKVFSFPPGLKWDNASHLAKGRSSELPAERFQASPWKLSSGLDDEILQSLRRQDCPRLLDVFPEVSQGIRTGANQFYIVPEAISASLEPELVLSYISGENIRRGQITPSELSLIWPYRLDERGSISVIPEDELRLSYPRSMRYFLNISKELSARNLDPSSAWYSYSRNQNLDLAQRPKIIARELMPSSEFAADEAGKYAICSGYALLAPSRMAKSELCAWAAILSTSTMEFQLRHACTQLHSGWFRILKQHLNSVHLPPVSNAQLSIAERLASELRDTPNNDELWRSLDMLVADAFGLTPAQRNHIKLYIDAHHAKSMPNTLFTHAVEGEKTISRSGVNLHDPSLALSLSDDQRNTYLPVELPEYYQLHAERESLRSAVTFVDNKEKPIHRWYSFTQGFSSEIVTALLTELGAHAQSLVYDPFAGSGTTLLACKQVGVASFGAEISPLMCWITSLKTKQWNDSDLSRAAAILHKARPMAQSPSIDVFQNFFGQAYAPNILGQIFAWRDWIRSNFDGETKDFFLLGLVSILEMVSQIRKHGSHYRFLNKTESVGLEKLNIPIIDDDCDIKPILLQRIDSMIRDTRSVQFQDPGVPAKIFNLDSRHASPQFRTADIVITSPPYLNRNMYFAQQKAELVLLNYISNYEDYRSLVRQTFRSHVEGNLDSTPISDIPEVQTIVDHVRLSENNNAKIPHMICGYFDDLRKTLRTLTKVLSNSAKLAFVVGNCRWGGVVVPVDHLLAMIAERLGYNVERVIVTRMKGNSPQQMRKYGRIPIRESVVLLHWKGPKN